MFYVPKYDKNTQRWALMINIKDCVKVETVLHGKGVQYTKVAL